MYKNTPIEQYNKLSNAIKENNQKIDYLKKHPGKLSRKELRTIQEQDAIPRKKYSYPKNIMSEYEAINKIIDKESLISIDLEDNNPKKELKELKESAKQLLKIKNCEAIYNTNKMEPATTKDGIKAIHDYNKTLDKERQKLIEPAKQQQARINLKKERKKKAKQLGDKRSL